MVVGSYIVDKALTDVFVDVIIVVICFHLESDA